MLGDGGEGSIFNMVVSEGLSVGVTSEQDLIYVRDIKSYQAPDTLLVPNVTVVRFYGKY